MPRVPESWGVACLLEDIGEEPVADVGVGCGAGGTAGGSVGTGVGVGVSIGFFAKAGAGLGAGGTMPSFFSDTTGVNYRIPWNASMNLPSERYLKMKLARGQSFPLI